MHDAQINYQKILAILVPVHIVNGVVNVYYKGVEFLKIEMRW
jgi:hypothetical protein